MILESVQRVSLTQREQAAPDVEAIVEEHEFWDIAGAMPPFFEAVDGWLFWEDEPGVRRLTIGVVAVPAP